MKPFLVTACMAGLLAAAGCTTNNTTAAGNPNVQSGTTPSNGMVAGQKPY